MSKKIVLTITHIVLIATPVIWLAWDTVALIFAGNPATESANIDVFGFYHPALPLFWGMLTTHFFMQRLKPTPTDMPRAVHFIQTKEAIITLVLSVSWLAFDWYFGSSMLARLVEKIPGPGHGAIEMVVIGGVLGYFFFQMQLATIPTE